MTFVGNSITDGGHYHSYIWLYYMTHFPKMRLWMSNCGVGGDYMMPEGFLNDNSERAAQKFRELCKDNAWLASKKGTYDQMVRPEVREAYQKEMELLVDRIYKLNQPKKHTFLLRKTSR